MNPNKIGRRRWSCKFLYLFLEKGAVHGLPYVGQKRFTVFERVLWFLLTLVALYFSVDLALESLDKYRTKSTVISIEKDYYFWNVTLPSVTICPMDRLSPERFDAYCRERYISGQDKQELWEFLEALANSTYINFDKIPDYPSIEKHQIEPADYMYLIYNLTEDYIQTRRVRTDLDLQEVIGSQQILSEWGICYTTNNFVVEDLNTNVLLFGKHETPKLAEPPDNNSVKIVKWSMFDGQVTYNFLGFTGPIQYFIHGAHEVMTIEKRSGFESLPKLCTVNTLDIAASDDFRRRTTVEQRQCRFAPEANLTHYPIYTKNVCYQECRMNLALKLCKCIPHFYPNRGAKLPVCHYKTLKSCLFQHAAVFENLNSIGDISLSYDDINCHCLPNCIIAEVTEKDCESLTQTDDLLTNTGVIVFVKQFPNLRYKRQIIFTLTDLLVSIGGTAGFFLGSSVLSAVEIIYYFTIRLLWYSLGYKE